MSEFEPKIIGFLCNWCAYEGADSAGRAQLEYPPNLRVLRVMCSGRVDPQFVLEALKDGADGVLILGCHPGDCHYKEGNYMGMRRSIMLKGLLVSLGVEEERVRLDWVSATEKERFAKIVTEMVEQIKKLGAFSLAD